MVGINRGDLQRPQPNPLVGRNNGPRLGQQSGGGDVVIGGAIGVRPKGVGNPLVAGGLVKGGMFDGGEPPGVASGDGNGACARTREGESHRERDEEGTDPLHYRYGVARRSDRVHLGDQRMLSAANNTGKQIAVSIPIRS